MNPWDEAAQTLGKSPAPQGSLPSQADFSAAADKAFGRGKYRITSGYRPPWKNAGTKGSAVSSHHQDGSPEEPGAFDLVVPGMSSSQAAAHMEKAGWQATYLPEGDHLHVTEHRGMGEAPTVPPWEEAKAAAAVAPTATMPGERAGPVPSGSQLKDGMQRHVPTAAERVSGSSDYGANVRVRGHEDLEAMREYNRVNPTGSPGGALMHPLKTLGAIGGAADFAVTPVEGGITALANAESRNPQGLPARVDRAAGLGTNISPDEARRAGDIAGLAVPLPGQAKLAKGGDEAARVVSEGERAFQGAEKAVSSKAQALYNKGLATLKRYGFDPTPGMAKGKSARMVEKTKEADSPAKAFYVKQADKAEDSFQRAKFNYDLEPLGGPKYRPTGPVGHKGVDAVYRTISGEFDKILPKVKLQRDAKLEGDLGKIEGQIERLQNDETRRVFNAIDHDVRQQLGRRGGTATVDGTAFKQIESDITKDSRTFREKGQWREADLLNDYLGALRSAMERHSSPEVAARLKAVNNAYARWSKTASAAARKPDALGKFTTSDLLHVFEQEDVSGGRSYARGKTPGQGFAKRAHEIMHPGPTLPSENDIGHIYPSHSGVAKAVIRSAARPVATAAAKRAAAAERARELLKRQGLQRPNVAGQVATGVGPQLAILSGQQN